MHVITSTLKIIFGQKGAILVIMNRCHEAIDVCVRARARVSYVHAYFFVLLEPAVRTTVLSV